MAIITIPTIRSSGANLRLIRGDTVMEFFGGGTVVAQSTKAVWALSFPLVVMKDSEARIWRAALAQLSKPANQFRATPPNYVHSTGYTSPIPAVKGASQLGLSLDCDTVDFNTIIGKVGDYIEINDTGEFKILTQDATSDGTGDVTFNFEPAIRTSPADGSAVWIGDSSPPRITMRLLAPIAEWSVELPDFYNITIDAIEAF